MRQHQGSLWNGDLICFGLPKGSWQSYQANMIWGGISPLVVGNHHPLRWHRFWICWSSQVEHEQWTTRRTTGRHQKEQAKDGKRKNKNHFPKWAFPSTWTERFQFPRNKTKPRAQMSHWKLARAGYPLLLICMILGRHHPCALVFFFVGYQPSTVMVLNHPPMIVRQNDSDGDQP